MFRFHWTDERTSMPNASVCVWGVGLSLWPQARSLCPSVGQCKDGVQQRGAFIYSARKKTYSLLLNSYIQFLKVLTEVPVAVFYLLAFHSSEYGQYVVFMSHFIHWLTCPPAQQNLVWGQLMWVPLDIVLKSTIHIPDVLFALKCNFGHSQKTWHDSITPKLKFQR